MPNRYHTLPYYGGKNQKAGINSWINRLLGPSRNRFYVEPFAGMLGVLMSRTPARNEIINDANSWVANWWSQVRDNHEELAHLVDSSPRSRQCFEECVEYQSAKIAENYQACTVEDAWRFFMVVSQSMHHGVQATKGNFAVVYGDMKPYKIWRTYEVCQLNERIRHVQIEHCCAIGLLQRIAGMKDALIYADPPYATADTSPYGKWSLPKGDFADAAASQQGRMVISGYNDEWDDLLDRGWFKYELDVHSSMSAGALSGISASDRSELIKRKEVCWMNYEYSAANHGLLL